MYIKLNHFAVHLKLTQHGKPTGLKLKVFSYSYERQLIRRRPSHLLLRSSLGRLRRRPAEQLRACARLPALVSLLGPRARCFPSCFSSTLGTYSTFRG